MEPNPNPKTVSSLDRGGADRTGILHRKLCRCCRRWYSEQIVARSVAEPKISSSSWSSPMAAPGPSSSEEPPLRLPSAEEIRAQDIFNNCAVRTVVSGVMGACPHPFLSQSRLTLQFFFDLCLSNCSDGDSVSISMLGLSGCC